MLDSLSPLRVVERGFSIVQKDGKLIKSIDAVQIGDLINIRLSHGGLLAEVKQKENP
jgi:exodeoxyribonuclease VII large subunit